MATLSNVLTFSRAQAQTDINGLSNANGIIFGNEALLDFRRRLIVAGVDASQLQEAYRDGIAGTGTYLYPTDMFWLKTIELNYSGTTSQDYKVATQVDVANIPGNKSFGWLRTNANPQTPYFDDRGDWYEIFPTPTGIHNTSQLIRIFYYLYSLGGENMAKGDAFNAKYEERVKQLIATLSRGSQQPLQATGIQLTGWEF